MKKAILNGYALNGYTVHSNLPIGAPMPWLSDNLPVGFLAFDGAEYNISDYPELYNVVKNIPSFHSETEGKFKIPNLKGRVLQGADAVIGELIEAGLPNITGRFLSSQWTQNKLNNGAFTTKNETNNEGASGNDNRLIAYFDASKGETKTDGTLKGADEPHVYGNSDTVQSPAFTVRWIIKATQYATVEQNAIDDTKFTTGNVLSAQKIAQYINDQNELSDIEDITLSTDSNNPTVMDYDGFLYIQKASAQDVKVTINGVMMSESTSSSTITCSVTLGIAVSKGDSVFVSRNATSYSGITNKVRYYKKRDYSQR